MSKLFLLFLAAIAVFRVVSFSHGYPEGSTILLTGRVVQDPIRYDNARFIVVEGLRAYVDPFPEIIYGDIVTIKGTVDGNRLVKNEVVSVKRGGGLFEIRRKILGIYQTALPEPHASLVGGIVLGSKSGMPGSFWEKLKGSGTAHVVVASGMNVTFVVSFLLNTLVNFTSRRRAIVLALAGAWVYVVLSGFDAPLIRAAIMGSLAFGAQALGRMGAALRTLILSALLMVIVRPDWVFDLGFILSFTATLSLILFEAKVSRMLSRIPFIFKKDLATTLAAQIGVAPILIVSFGGMNILTPLINSLVLWTTPPIMIIGAAAAFLGLVFSPLGQLVTYTLYPFTFWFITIVEVFS